MTDTPHSRAADVRFFTMADSDYFLGLVALVRSLRLHGHRFPITVLDLGLSPEQRSMLGTHCDLVRAPQAAGRHPWFLGPFPFLVHAEGTVVYVDSDVIVTQPLDAVLAAAQRGMVCAAPDPELGAGRWFAEWESIFELDHPPRRQAYVTSGFVAFSVRHFPDLLRRWWECSDRLARATLLPLPGTSPIALPDQDALNALLMSEVPPERLWLLPDGTAAQGSDQLARTTVVDRRRLECRFEGRPTVLLHAFGAFGTPKPWQPDAQRDLRRTAYLICLRALLTTQDAVVTLGPTTPPPWLRPGPHGAVALRVLCAVSRARRAAARAKRLLGKVRRRAGALITRNTNSELVSPRQN